MIGYSEEDILIGCYWINGSSIWLL